MTTDVARSSAASVRRAVVAIAFTVAATGAVTGAARADPFDTLEQLDQDGFLALSETLAAATHYKAVTPAEPLGVLGLDVGVELSSTAIDEELFDRASDGDYGAGSVLLPRLHVHKGLPFGIDIGAFLGAIPETEVSLIGGELRLALVEGGVATPAIALRGSYSRVQGSNALDLENAALELTVSKGFLMFTPYAGVGFVHSEAVSLAEDSALAEEAFDQEKLYAGVNVNLIGFNLTAEADRTGEHTSLSAKIGIRF